MSHHRFNTEYYVQYTVLFYNINIRKMNIKEEFIQLENFKLSIVEKIKLLENMRPENQDDTQVINSQISWYKAILWEIDMFIEWLADDDKDKLNYLYESDENI